MIWIGIDPGTITGLALWDSKEQKFIEIQSCGIIEAMELVLHYCSASCFGFMVRVEDARKRKKFGTQDWNPKKYQGVGSVKRESAIWQEFLSHHDIPHVMVHPRLTKLNAEKFKIITNWEGRTNGHMRDAAMLVYGMKANAKVSIDK